MDKKQITVKTSINAPIEKVWQYWNESSHITKWYFASDDWEAPFAENDLKVNGNFKITMAAKDKSASFDFEGKYTNVIPHELIEYILGDDRRVSIKFNSLSDNETEILETFDLESQNSQELQRSGWQAILDNFKKYTESN